MIIILLLHEVKYYIIVFVLKKRKNHVFQITDLVKFYAETETEPELNNSSNNQIKTESNQSLNF